MYSPSTPSMRPSGPPCPQVGVYRAKRVIPYSTFYAFGVFLLLLGLAFCVYLWLTGGK